jgi:hypothetical protein
MIDVCASAPPESNLHGSAQIVFTIRDVARVTAAIAVAGDAGEMKSVPHHHTGSTPDG